MNNRSQAAQRNSRPTGPAGSAVAAAAAVVGNERMIARGGGEVSTTFSTTPNTNTRRTVLRSAGPASASPSTGARQRQQRGVARRTRPRNSRPSPATAAATTTATAGATASPLHSPNSIQSGVTTSRSTSSNIIVWTNDDDDNDDDDVGDNAPDGRRRRRLRNQQQQTVTKSRARQEGQRMSLKWIIAVDTPAGHGKKLNIVRGIESLEQLEERLEMQKQKLQKQQQQQTPINGKTNVNNNKPTPRRPSQTKTAAATVGAGATTATTATCKTTSKPRRPSNNSDNNTNPSAPAPAPHNNDNSNNRRPSAGSNSDINNEKNLCNSPRSSSPRSSPRNSPRNSPRSPTTKPKLNVPVSPRQQPQLQQQQQPPSPRHNKPGVERPRKPRQPPEQQQQHQQRRPDVAYVAAASSAAAAAAATSPTPHVQQQKQLQRRSAPAASASAASPPPQEQQRQRRAAAGPAPINENRTRGGGGLPKNKRPARPTVPGIQNNNNPNRKDDNKNNNIMNVGLQYCNRDESPPPSPVGSARGGSGNNGNHEEEDDGLYSQESNDGAPSPSLNDRTDMTSTASSSIRSTDDMDIMIHHAATEDILSSVSPPRLPTRVPSDVNDNNNDVNNSYDTAPTHMAVGVVANGTAGATAGPSNNNNKSRPPMGVSRSNSNSIQGSNHSQSIRSSNHRKIIRRSSSHRHMMRGSGHSTSIDDSRDSSLPTATPSFMSNDEADTLYDSQYLSLTNFEESQQQWDFCDGGGNVGYGDDDVSHSHQGESVVTATHSSYFEDEEEAAFVRDYVAAIEGTCLGRPREASQPQPQQQQRRQRQQRQRVPALHQPHHQQKQQQDQFQLYSPHRRQDDDEDDEYSDDYDEGNYHQVTATPRVSNQQRYHKVAHQVEPATPRISNHSPCYHSDHAEGVVPPPLYASEPSEYHDDNYDDDDDDDGEEEAEENSGNAMPVSSAINGGQQQPHHHRQRHQQLWTSKQVYQNHDKDQTKRPLHCHEHHPTNQRDENDEESFIEILDDEDDEQDDGASKNDSAPRGNCSVHYDDDPNVVDKMNDSLAEILSEAGEDVFDEDMEAAAVAASAPRSRLVDRKPKKKKPHPKKRSAHADSSDSSIEAFDDGCSDDDVSIQEFVQKVGKNGNRGGRKEKKFEDEEHTVVSIEEYYRKRGKVECILDRERMAAAANSITADDGSIDPMEALGDHPPPAMAALKKRRGGLPEDSYADIENSFSIELSYHGEESQVDVAGGDECSALTDPEEFIGSATAAQRRRRSRNRFSHQDEYLTSSRESFDDLTGPDSLKNSFNHSLPSLRENKGETTIAQMARQREWLKKVNIAVGREPPDSNNDSKSSLEYTVLSAKNKMEGSLNLSQSVDVFNDDDEHDEHEEARHSSYPAASLIADNGTGMPVRPPGAISMNTGNASESSESSSSAYSFLGRDASTDTPTFVQLNLETAEGIQVANNKKVAEEENHHGFADNEPDLIQTDLHKRSGNRNPEEVKASNLTRRLFKTRKGRVGDATNKEPSLQKERKEKPKGEDKRANIMERLWNFGNSSFGDLSGNEMLKDDDDDDGLYDIDGINA